MIFSKLLLRVLPFFKDFKNLSLLALGFFLVVLFLFGKIYLDKADQRIRDLANAYVKTKQEKALLEQNLEYLSNKYTELYKEYQEKVEKRKSCEQSLESVTQKLETCELERKTSEKELKNYTTSLISESTVVQLSEQLSYQLCFDLSKEKPRVVNFEQLFGKSVEESLSDKD